MAEGNGKISKVTTETIINEIADEYKIPVQVVKNVMKGTKRKVAEHIGKGEAVQLTGFVMITPQYRAARIANNISTHQKETIPETVGVSIKAGVDIKREAAKLSPADWKPTETDK